MQRVVAALATSLGIGRRAVLADVTEQQGLIGRVAVWLGIAAAPQLLHVEVDQHQQ